MFLFLLLARTGVHIGEALALQWGDVAFNEKFIWVSKTYYQGKIGSTKTSRQRKVDISNQLTKALKTHKSASKKKGLALGKGDKPEFIFTNTVGTPIDVDGWRRRVFNKALEKAGVRKIRINDLRHTYASLRILKGDNIAGVSKQLGHSSVKLTLDIYTHVIPGKHKSEVDAFDDPEFSTHPNAPCPI